MRTTVDIDDDVLAAARELARAEGRTMGQVISDLARRALTQPGLMAGTSVGMMAGTVTGMEEAQVAYMADDFPVFPLRSDGPLVTGDMVRRLQDAADAEDGEAWDHGRDLPRAAQQLPSAPKTGRG